MQYTPALTMHSVSHSLYLKSYVSWYFSGKVSALMLKTMLHYACCITENEKSIRGEHKFFSLRRKIHHLCSREYITASLTGGCQPNYRTFFTVGLAELISFLGDLKLRFYLDSLILVEHLHPMSQGKSFKSQRQFMWLPQRPAFSSLYYQVF